MAMVAITNCANRRLESTTKNIDQLPGLANTLAVDDCNTPSSVNQSCASFQNTHMLIRRAKSRRPYGSGSQLSDHVLSGEIDPIWRLVDVRIEFTLQHPPALPVDDERDSSFYQVLRLVHPHRFFAEGERIFFVDDHFLAQAEQLDLRDDGDPGDSRKNF